MATSGAPRRLGLISNPMSGANKRRGLSEVHRLLARHPEVAYREVRSAADVSRALRDFARAGVDLVGVNSGDGTVQAVLTSLFVERPFASPPLLALLAGGTTNMSFQDLGLKGSLTGALGRLIRWARTGEGEARVLRRPVLEVVNSSHPGPLYGLFVGAAGIYNGIRFFHRRVRRMGLRGDPAHLFVLVRFLLGLARGDDALVAPVQAEIQTDRTHLPPMDYRMLLVTTLDRLIAGVRPFWGEGGGPLRLAALGMRPRRLLKTVPAVVRGRPSRWASIENGYVGLSAARILLTMRGGFAIDGELFQADPARGPLLIRDGGLVRFLRL
jgi:diacylglycerol kinase (ATP)